MADLPYVKLLVIVHTKNVDGAGTDSDIQLQVIGNRGVAGWYDLDPDGDSFERGDYDPMLFEVDQNFGEQIEALRIRTREESQTPDAPDWHLDWIKVYPLPWTTILPPNWDSLFRKFSDAAVQVILDNLPAVWTFSVDEVIKPASFSKRGTAGEWNTQKITGSGISPDDLVPVTGDAGNDGEGASSSDDEFVIARFLNNATLSVSFRFRWGDPWEWHSATLSPGERTFFSWKPAGSFWSQFRPSCQLIGSGLIHRAQANIVKSDAPPSWETPSSVSTDKKIKVTVFSGNSQSVSISDKIETEWVIARFVNGTQNPIHFRFRWGDPWEWHDATLEAGQRTFVTWAPAGPFWANFRPLCYVPATEATHVVQANIVNSIATPSWNSLSSVSSDKPIKYTLFKKSAQAILIVDEFEGSTH